MIIPTKVHLELADGTTITVRNGDGGTFEEPIDRGHNVGSYDLEDDGVAFKCLLPDFETSGKVLPFESFYATGGPALQWVEGQFDRDTGRNYMIPPAQTNPDHLSPGHRIPESDQWHVLAGGNVLFCFFHGKGLSTPAPEQRALVGSILSRFTSFNEQERWPRVKHCIELFRDRDQPLGARGMDRDQGWLMRWWNRRVGGPERNGWRAMSCPKWGSGYDGGHYDGRLWPLLNFMNTGDSKDWYFSLTQAMMHCSLERCNDPNAEWYGAQNYEKGTAFSGDYHKRSMAKQWFMGPLSHWLITGRHSYFTPFVMAWKRMCEEVSIKWKGAWGSRIGANQLRMLTLCYTIFPTAKLKAKIQEAVNEFMSYLDDDMMIWRNHDDGRYPASPWMNFQLADAIYGAHMYAGAEFDMDRLLDAITSIFERGVYRVHGKLGTRYRIDPPEPAGNIMLNCFSIACLKIIAMHRPTTSPATMDQTWPELLHEMQEFTYGYVGSNWNDVAAGRLAPLRDIGYEYAPQGVGGWPKALKFPPFSLSLSVNANMASPKPDPVDPVPKPDPIDPADPCAVIKEENRRLKEQLAALGVGT